MSVGVFGQHEGQDVYEATIRSGAGAEAKVITYGAVVRDLVVPAPAGRQRVVNGLETIDNYARYSPHFGAIAGRYANRIAGGRFSIGGEAYQLSLNQDNKHSLHGGGRGLGKQVWQLAASGKDFVTLIHVSPDGEAGYPGTLTTACTYRLVGSTLRVELQATTDRASPVNLCHHSYFNLDGGDTILDHTLELAADFYTPVDEDLIPTGEIRSVEGTPFDFRKARPVRMERPGGGGRFWYDNNVVLRRDRLEPSGIDHRPLAFAATFASPKSGVAMQVWTTEPGLQVYDGFKTNVPVLGLDGARYGANSGLCLEPQHFPDSPNHAHFPGTILRPGEVYRQVTEYRF
ncbi:MAG TPA: aldose epimerase family protein [Microvirga sp.]|jgi:aldose 1-epimerase|nr:aldose epimerase family protein [Microvirga sp.]